MVSPGLCGGAGCMSHKGAGGGCPGTEPSAPLAVVHPSRRGDSGFPPRLRGKREPYRLVNQLKLSEGGRAPGGGELRYVSLVAVATNAFNL